MKKRLMCLVLCLVMSLSAILTACSSKTDDEVEDEISQAASETAKTLTMWIVSEEEISEATALSVTEELNKITRSKFKTELVITFLTEDKYRSELEKVIKAREEQIAAETTATEGDEDETDKNNKKDDETVETDEIGTDDLGMSVIIYPDPEPNQVDIVYISGEDMYIDFINNGWLASLDTELSVSSKKIKEYVSSTLLSAAQVNGSTYAIPNNRTIGEYTYMLMDKELMDRYSMHSCIKTGSIDGFHNEYVYAFLDLVSKEASATAVPIDATYEECVSMLAHYWSFSPSDYSALSDFSVFGYHYKDISELNRGSVALGFNSLFEDEDFTAQYLKLNQFKFDGYYRSEEDADKKSAVRFVTGDYTLMNEFNTYGYCTYENEEYYLVPVGYPSASSDDIYGHMFGVCSYSKNVSRAMQVITYINTNSDFRNILQYGKEGTNYRLNKDEATKKVTLERLNNDYMMNIFATGNAFIAYPEPTMSQNIWESGKIQNRYSQVDPLLGFDLTSYAEQIGATETGKTLAEEGYNISYTTGYTKYAFSQNAELAAWLTACDSTGNGLYILQTSTVKGQFITVDYYVYHKGLTKNVKFNVEDVRVMTTQVNEKTGEEEEVQTDLDFILTYTDTETASANGYELSVFSLYTKKTNEYEILAKQNGMAITPNVTVSEKTIDLDVMNSNQYQIEYYNLTKAAVRENKLLTEWIKDCDVAWLAACKAADPEFEASSGVYDFTKGVSSTYAKAFVSDDGKTTTYVIYRTGLTYITDLEFLPLGDTGKLALRFSYTDDGESLLDLNPSGSDLPEANYILSYVRVTELSDVELSCNLIVNSEAQDVEFTAFDTDPDYDIIGNLDTELIKYMYDLNQTLVAKLNACTNMEELERTVDDIAILLSTGTNAPKLSAFSNVKGNSFRTFVNENYTEAASLESFHNKVLRFTSSEIIKNMVLDTSEGAAIGSKVEDSYKDALGTKEAYVYYESPFCIYYTWMETYGYLPKDASAS